MGSLLHNSVRSLLNYNIYECKSTYLIQMESFLSLSKLENEDVQMLYSSCTIVVDLIRMVE